MKYSGNFIIIVIISSISGIFFAILNNDLTIDHPKNYFLQKNDNSFQDQSKENKNLEITKNEIEEEYKKSEKENNKNFEEEIKKKYNEEKKNTNENQEEIVERTKNTNIHKYKEDGKIIIACAYALDNAYVFPTLVAMTSLVENASKKTFYDIYALIGSGFKNKYKRVLLSVQKKHKDNCKINFIDMADKFKKVDVNKKIPVSSYYRLELPSLLPDINRIIFMDGDTAVFEDLTELITIDMKNNYIMGFLDSMPDAIESFGVKNATVLCAGVLLLDLDALRKNNIQEKMYKFINDNLGKLEQHDQTVINVVCQNNIGILPPKFGIFGFESEEHALEHNERQRPWLKYDKQEFINAYHHPTILHYVWPKPFWRKPVLFNEWWKYAKISGFYYWIHKKSPKFIFSERKKSKYLSDKEIEEIVIANVCFVTFIIVLVKIIKNKTIIDNSK